MADNCGLEIVFSLMNEKDNGYWPKFNTLPNTKISHISSDIEDDLDEIIPVCLINFIIRDQHYGILKN